MNSLKILKQCKKLIPPLSAELHKGQAGTAPVQTLACSSVLLIKRGARSHRSSRRLERVCFLSLGRLVCEVELTHKTHSKLFRSALLCEHVYSTSRTFESQTRQSEAQGSWRGEQGADLAHVICEPTAGGTMRPSLARDDGLTEQTISGHQNIFS